MLAGGPAGRASLFAGNLHPPAPLAQTYPRPSLPRPPPSPIVLSLSLVRHHRRVNCHSPKTPLLPLPLSLFFSRRLFLPPLPLNPKKGEHKSYRQDALRPPNFPQDRRPWCRRHLGTYIPFHFLSRRLSVKWRRKEQEVETLPHTSSGRSRRTRRAGLDGRHVYRDRSGSWAGTTRPLSLLSSLNTDGVALALAGMHWIASLTLVSYHIGPNCRCPRCRRRRYQVLCYRQAW